MSDIYLVGFASLKKIKLLITKDGNAAVSAPRPHSGPASILLPWKSGSESCSISIGRQFLSFFKLKSNSEPPIRFVRITGRVLRGKCWPLTTGTSLNSHDLWGWIIRRLCFCRDNNYFSKTICRQVMWR